jgi:hypothetical protein
MPAKGHDKNRGAKGSTKKPLHDHRFSSGKHSKRELERKDETQNPDMSPSPGGWPEGQPMEQKH